MNPESGDRNDGSWRFVMGGVLLLATGFFLFGLRELLNPFLLYLVIIALLVPLRGVRGRALVVTVATVLAGLWVLHAAGSLLAPFFLVFVCAYILDPVVDRVSAHPRINRTAATLLTLLPFVAVVAVAMVLGLPILARQAQSLMGLSEQALVWVRQLTPASLVIDIPFVDEAEFLGRLQAIDAEALRAFLIERREMIARGIWGTLLGLGQGIGTLFTLLGYLVLSPVLMFYLLRDYDRIVAQVDNLLPSRVRERARDFFREYDNLLARYLRGQVALSLLSGGIIWVGLLIAGFPYAFVLGLTAALLGIVPYLGMVVSLTAAVIVALLSGEVGVSLLKVAMVYGGAWWLEDAVFYPRIASKSVGLHPVWLLLALSLGGFFFGFVGLLISEPLAVGVKLLLVRMLEAYRSSALYQEEGTT